MNPGEKEYSLSPERRRNTGEEAWIVSVPFIFLMYMRDKEIRRAEIFQRCPLHFVVHGRFTDTSPENEKAE